MGYRRAPSEASGIDVGRKPLHPGLISYVRHSPGKLRQPRPRHPRTSCALPPNPVSLQASWSCSRPIRCGRIALQPISSDNPSRGRGAVPRTPRRRGLDPARPSHLSRDSDRSRQGERYEAIIRAHGPEILENLNTPNWPEVMASEPGVATAGLQDRDAALPARSRGAVHEQSGGAGSAHHEAGHEGFGRVPLGAESAGFRHATQRAVDGSRVGIASRCFCRVRRCCSTDCAASAPPRCPHTPQHRHWA